MTVGMFLSDGRIDEDGLRERFGLRHTSDEAFGMSGPCFAEHGFPAGNDLIGVPEPVNDNGTLYGIN